MLNVRTEESAPKVMGGVASWETRWQVKCKARACPTPPSPSAQRPQPLLGPCIWLRRCERLAHAACRCSRCLLAPPCSHTCFCAGEGVLTDCPQSLPLALGGCLQPVVAWSDTCMDVAAVTRGAVHTTPEQHGPCVFQVSSQKSLIRRAS